MHPMQETAESPTDAELRRCEVGVKRLLPNFARGCTPASCSEAMHLADDMQPKALFISSTWVNRNSNVLIFFS